MDAFLFRRKSFFPHILVTQRNFGNQFNNRIVQSFILCHNLIKIRNSISEWKRGKTENAKYTYRECALYAQCTLTHTNSAQHKIYDYWLFTSLVFYNKSMCIFSIFRYFDVLDSITFYVIIYKMFITQKMLQTYLLYVWVETLSEETTEPSHFQQNAYICAVCCRQLFPFIGKILII